MADDARVSPGGRVLYRPQGGSFRFDGGAVVVDFAPRGGEGRDGVGESLHRPRDLADWLAVPPLDVPRSLAVSDDDLVASRSARTAFHTLLQAPARGRPAPRAAVTAVNRVAAHPPLVPKLGTAGSDGWV